LLFLPPTHSQMLSSFTNLIYCNSPLTVKQHIWSIISLHPHSFFHPHELQAFNQFSKTLGQSLHPYLTSLFCPNIFSIVAASNSWYLCVHFNHRYLGIFFLLSGSVWLQNFFIGGT
jgi:hypothetical protein